MAMNEKALESLTTKLSERSREIREAFATSSEFRSICEDFDECARALRHWETEPSRGASANRDEYRRLLEELEQEMLDWLDTH